VVKVLVNPIVALRDVLAHILAKVGVTPNMLTVLGVVFTLIAAYILARGAEQTWSGSTIPASVWAAGWLFLACAMDMLDGALARVAGMKTRFGGILDSTMDRISDIAIFGGIALAYGRIGNMTYQLLTMVAMGNAILISYVKARAETEIDDCTVGYWQRGERMVGILIACATAHIATLVTALAFLPMLTVVKRLLHCHRRLTARASDHKPIEAAGSFLGSLAFWRYARGSWPHTIASAGYITILVLVDIEPSDFLRGLFHN